MRYATNFVDDAQKIQREYYLGNIQHDTAIVMMSELMRHHGVIAENEVLVEIPECFRSAPQTGFVGEFTVRQKDSPYTWKRSFARNMPIPQHIRIKEISSTDVELIRRSYTSPALRKFAASPPLSEEQRKFFCAYEKQLSVPSVDEGESTDEEFKTK
jgi:hypothetical protein